MGLVRALRRHLRRQTAEADCGRRRRHRRGSRPGKRRPSDSTAGVRARVAGERNKRTESLPAYRSRRDRR